MKDSRRMKPPDSGTGIWVRRAFAEGIGTFFLVFVGAGAIAVDAQTGGAIGHVGIALAFAFVVLAMIYAIAHVSGAHINPAVTLGFWSVGRFPGKGVLPYLAAQTGGAGLAALAVLSIVGPAGGVGATVPAVGARPAVMVELLLSFSLMFVIMAMATDRRAAPGSAGLAIGLTVGFGAIFGGPLTGGSMNPARSLGPALAGGGWEAHWIYWVAPTLGMLLAARAYELLRPADAHRPAKGVPTGVRGPLGDAAPVDAADSVGHAAPFGGAAPLDVGEFPGDRGTSARASPGPSPAAVPSPRSRVAPRAEGR
jgi:MIP family channel proteins